MVIPSNVEVPLSSKESHVHLHLGIKMTHTSGLLLLLLAAVLLHLPDGVQEEQDQNCHQDVEVVNQLILKTLEES